MDDVAVIGHGPSPEGRGWGHLIDGSATVVRMHDWHRQPAADYGQRCDFAVLPGPWLLRALGQVERPPRDGWLVYRLPGRDGAPVSEHLAGLRAFWHEDDLAPALAPLGDFAPTRGLMGLVMMALRLTALKRIVAVGMDSIRAGVLSGYPAWYGAQPPAAYIGQTRNPRHAADLEKIALVRLAEITGVEIVHAEDIWP